MADRSGAIPVMADGIVFEVLSGKPVFIHLKNATYGNINGKESRHSHGERF